MAAYSIAITDCLTEQLARFATLNSHQLAGHVANLDFWSDELAHALRLIDGYNARFKCLTAAQSAYVTTHHTIKFEHADIYGTGAKPPPRPRRIPDSERSSARHRLCEAFYRFIVRCNHTGLIDAPAARKACQRHDISVDSRDLKHRRAAKPGD